MTAFIGFFVVVVVDFLISNSTDLGTVLHDSTVPRGLYSGALPQSL